MYTLLNTDVQRREHRELRSVIGHGLQIGIHLSINDHLANRSNDKEKVAFTWSKELSSRLGFSPEQRSLSLKARLTEQII